MSREKQNEMQEIERLTKNHGITYTQKVIAKLKKKYTDDKECPMCKHFAGCEQACGGMVCDEYEVSQT